MILMVSGRTDVVAFYTPWFMNRYKEGFLDVRNPFYCKNISRIYFKDVDAIVFCTKNPIPILNEIDKIDKPILFHITLTPYKKDIEVNVPNKKEIIDAIKILSNKIGKDRVVVRYDPIIVNDKYTIDYHIKAFNRLCSLLNGYIETIIVSFVDDYKNVRNNYKDLKIRSLVENDYKEIGENFSKLAKENGISVQTCAEERNLVEYDFRKRDCVDLNLAYLLTGKTKFKKWKARNRKECNCVEMVDVGVYNSCKHLCKYCYANYDEKQVIDNSKKHNPLSTLLIGELEKVDVIKIRTN